MRLVTIALITLVGLAIAAPLIAQDAPRTEDAPVLSVEQRQAVTILAQSMEIAQLRAQQAQRDFDQAREQLGKLLQSLEREGFALDLQTMTYVKKPEAGKPPK